MKKIFIVFALIGTMFLQADAFGRPTFTETVHGKPDMRFYKEKMKLAIKMGVDYKIVFNGCIIKPGEEKVDVKEIEKNIKALEYYNKELGEGWLDYLNNEARKASSQK